MKPKILKFPKNFYWGTATSAYQVEGGIKNDWSEWEQRNAERLARKAKSYWQDWQIKNFPEMLKPENYICRKACDHYNRFEEDFDLAKQMNTNAHRFSISWARIEPKEGKFDQKEIEHYRKVICSLRARNLEPFVTLYHWPVPVWFVERGHWFNKKAPQYFERFVERIVGEYKDLVKFWITLNEPNVYTSHSFLRGGWPPFKKNWFKTQKVLRQLIEAHKKAYQKIHKISSDSQVGIAKCNIYYKGILKFLYNNYYWNHKFLNAIEDYQDFIGLNFYHSYSIKGPLKESRKAVSDIGFEIYPRGIYYALKDLKRYKKPIYITENGLADAKDEKRAKFIIDHLKWIHKAIEEGVDVRGYFHWSLMDNFEWDKGFWPRFGLIEIDYKTLRRIPRDSSRVYAKICKNNAIKL
jgi:beta-glucosidase